MNELLMCSQGINKTYTSTNEKTSLNPFDQSVNILAPSDIQTINLYDLAGKLCEIVYLSNSNRCTIQTSQLAAGAYILDVMLLDGTKLKTKIVKL